jgi:GT2 family glycosyltransferase
MIRIDEAMSSVDVIVPCYNYGRYLETCVGSVLTQEGVRARVLIVDDCSSDITEETGRRLAQCDPRVTFARHAVNQGHIATYNEALARVTADYCMILSPDDLLTRGSLLRAVQVMNQHPEVGLTYGRDIPFRDTPPADAVAQPAGTHRIYGYPEFLALSCSLGHTPIQAPTAVVRTSLHRTIGFFLPELPHSGDTEIWLRMAAHADVCELEAVQAFRRLHSQNMSVTFSPLARLEEQRKAFRTHFQQYAAQQPDVAHLESVMNRTIAESAFWTGVRAFETGNLPESAACLESSRNIWPQIASSRPWRRFQWKRRVAPAMVWRQLARLRRPSPQ